MFKNSLYLFLIFCIALLNLLIDDNAALLPLTFLLVGIGLLVITITNNNELPNSLSLYLLFFFVYLLHSTLIHYGLLEMYGITHIKSDETHFYLLSNKIASLLETGQGFLDLTKDVVYRDIVGAVYLSGNFALLAELIGENSVLVQKLLPVFAGALIPPLIYGISRNYYSSAYSEKIALIYGFLSFTLYLSSILLRDIYIAAVFVMTFHILLQKVSIKNLFLLLCLTFISYSLRQQTGTFMFGFISIYLFLIIHNSPLHKYFKYFIYIGIFVTLIIFVKLFLSSSMGQILDSSVARQTSQASGSSIGAKLRKLPLPLEVITLFSYGQIQPFPLKLIFTGEKKGILQLSYLVGGIVWFFAWGFILYGVFRKRILLTIDFKLNFLFFFSLIYLFLISYIEYSVRRQMAVYPILYLVAVFSYLEMTVSERTKVWIGMGMLYLALILSINYMKI